MPEKGMLSPSSNLVAEHNHSNNSQKIGKLNNSAEPLRNNKNSYSLTMGNDKSNLERVIDSGTSDNSASFEEILRDENAKVKTEDPDNEVALVADKNKNQKNKIIQEKSKRNKEIGKGVDSTIGSELVGNGVLFRNDNTNTSLERKSVSSSLSNLENLGKNKSEVLSNPDIAKVISTHQDKLGAKELDAIKTAGNLKNHPLQGLKRSNVSPLNVAGNEQLNNRKFAVDSEIDPALSNNEIDIHRQLKHLGNKGELTNHELANKRNLLLNTNRGIVNNNNHQKLMGLSNETNEQEVNKLIAHGSDLELKAEGKNYYKDLKDKSLLAKLSNHNGHGELHTINNMSGNKMVGAEGNLNLPYLRGAYISGKGSNFGKLDNLDGIDVNTELGEKLQISQMKKHEFFTQPYGNGSIPSNLFSLDNNEAPDEKAILELKNKKMLNNLSLTNINSEGKEVENGGSVLKSITVNHNGPLAGGLSNSGPNFAGMVDASGMVIDAGSSINLINQITNYLAQMSAAKERSTELVFNHSDLGRIALQVSKGKNAGLEGIDVQIKAQESMGSNFFNHYKDELITNLEKAGIKVNDFRVDAPVNGNMLLSDMEKDLQKHNSNREQNAADLYGKRQNDQHFAGDNEDSRKNRHRNYQQNFEERISSIRPSKIDPLNAGIYGKRDFGSYYKNLNFST